MSSAICCPVQRLGTNAAATAWFVNMDGPDSLGEKCIRTETFAAFSFRWGEFKVMWPPG